MSRALLACLLLTLSVGCAHTHPKMERDLHNTATVVVQHAEWWDVLLGAMEGYVRGGRESGPGRAF